MVLLLAAALLATQVQTSATAGRDSLGRREVGIRVQVGDPPGSDPVRRIAVTAEHLRTAFRTPAAGTLLTRARRARGSQDSALHTYDAKVRQRISVGMSLRASSRERLVMRDEAVARVQWDHKAGAVVDMLGKRTTVPAADNLNPVDESIRRDPQLPIPYFPGRETLWVGASVARMEVNEESFVHPIADGSEAYYKYAIGDSVEFLLPDGKQFMLRELRVEARTPQWNLMVGSFWFDQASAQLVRAVYRPAIEMDIWEIASDAAERDSTDEAPPGWVKGLVSPMRAVLQVFTTEYSLFESRFWLPVSQSAEGKLQVMFLHVPGMFEERFEYSGVNRAVDVATPMSRVPAPPFTVRTGTIRNLRDSLRKAGLDSLKRDSIVTYRYGYGQVRFGDFWSYHDSVRRTLPPPNAFSRADTIALAHFGYKDRTGPYRAGMRDSLTRAGRDSAYADSVVRARYDSPLERNATRARARRDSLAALGLTEAQADSAIRAQQRARNQFVTDSLRARRDSTCRANGHVAVRTRMYEQSVDVLVRTPCDLQSLAKSPELPASPYAANEEVFSTKDRDKLLGALDFALQAGWGPQRIGVEWGLSQSRYNRVEGFSTGIGLKQELGLGLAWNAKLRAGQGDKEINGEVGISRGNGRVTFAGTAYRRLVSANDWGNPLTLGSSLPGLFFGRDEGFYYRAIGAEATRTSDFHGTLTLRMFAERQSNAPVTTRFSVFGGSHNDAFIDNVETTKATYIGVSARWGESWGLSPRGWNTTADFRAEAAGGGTQYGRSALDLSVSHGLFGRFSLGIAGAVGSSFGDVPPQRHWFLGGVQTVRGMTAGFASGDAFWFTRTELAFDRNAAARRSIFADLGWAGSREDDFGRKERPLFGVGVGASFLSGMIRTDLSFGQWPKTRTRFDIYLEAPF